MPTVSSTRKDDEGKKDNGKNETGEDQEIMRWENYTIISRTRFDGRLFIEHGVFFSQGLPRLVPAR